MWLDGADRSTLSLSGASVTQWRDKSGLNNHAYQDIVAVRPSYSTQAMNSRYPGIVFTASIETPGNTTTPSNFTFLHFPNAQGGTDNASYFVVFQSSNISRNAHIISNWKAQYGQLNAIQTNRFQASSATSYSPQNISATASLNPTLAAFTYSTGTTNTFTAGLNASYTTNITSVTPPSSTADNNPLGIIGAYLENVPTPYYGGTYNGSISEILIFTRALTLSQRQQMEGYLAWKWGLVGNLPSTHPFKRFPPP
jgi:hypothetical protein